MSGRSLGDGIISNSQQQAAGQSQHTEVNIMVSQLKQNTKLTWMLWVTLTNLKKNILLWVFAVATPELIKDIITLTSSGLICSLCRTIRIGYANLKLYWSVVVQSGRCNLFITIKNTKWQCVFNHHSITLSYLSPWATRRFFSYKKRANPLSVFAMRARTSAMRVSVAAGDFNLACKPRRINRRNYPTQLQTRGESQEGWADIENWNDTIDGNEKSLLHFHKFAISKKIVKRQQATVTSSQLLQCPSNLITGTNTYSGGTVVKTLRQWTPLNLTIEF